ncbi:MAG: hypothetical protein JXQ75_10830 [Phycisphaerae bacterium]|nr:hypothetical protein [Phycisphaerae bacterium]
MDAMRFVRLSRVGWTVLVLGLFHYCASATAAPTDLFERYGDGGRHFEEVETAHMLVYFHQRMIGEATVEKDYIVYQFDNDTGELLARKSHWRDGLPATLPQTLLSGEQAEALVDGEIQSSRLYIISPESDVFPLDPTPESPCWCVRSIDEHGEYVVTVIDAVAGVILGNGVPPPYTAFSLTGPWYFSPCSGGWTDWSENAESWFNTMGYSTEEVLWPTQAKIQSHIQSNETAMFYELAHGGSDYFASGCVGGNDPEYTTASEIEAWMAGYEKMPFAFIGSCAGMCSTGNNTFAYEFRKGSDENTTVVGYCGMSEPQCDICWSYSIAWQDSLFYYMNLGWAVKDAFEQANADYPVCAGDNDCMRFAGDEDFAVVPPVSRVPSMEACCVPSQPCFEDTVANCTAAGGTAQGAGTVCLGQQACCMPDGSCEFIDEICCDDEGGVSQGPRTVCLGDGNGDGTDEACDCDTCPGDMDRSNNVDIYDLDQFVTALLSDPSDWCADINDDGKIDGRDIHPFVDRVLANGGAGTPC